MALLSDLSSRVAIRRPGGALWNGDLGHAGSGAALKDVIRQQSQGFSRVAGVHRPPDRVPAVAACGEGNLVAKRAGTSSEGGEHGPTLVWLMTVVKEEESHVSTVSLLSRADIGVIPRLWPCRPDRIRRYPDGGGNDAH